MKIVLATKNSGKAAEMQAAFASANFEILSQEALGIPSVAETGLTFIENALLKARHASHYSELPAVADDSGLVLPALQGAPGIYSARYAGEFASSEDNMSKLLRELKDKPTESRAAYFYCVMVYLKYPEDPTPLICEGVWHGTIRSEPVGQKGFGYDPIFHIPEQNCSAAELTVSQKNNLSHRGKALAMLIQKLQSQ